MLGSERTRGAQHIAGEAAKRQTEVLNAWAEPSVTTPQAQPAGTISWHNTGRWGRDSQDPRAWAISGGGAKCSGTDCLTHPAGVPAQFRLQRR